MKTDKLMRILEKLRATGNISVNEIYGVTVVDCNSLLVLYYSNQKEEYIVHTVLENGDRVWGSYFKDPKAARKHFLEKPGQRSGYWLVKDEDANHE